MRTKEEINQWLRTIDDAEKAFKTEAPVEYQKLIVELLLDIRELLTN